MWKSDITCPERGAGYPSGRSPAHPPPLPAGASHLGRRRTKNPLYGRPKGSVLQRFVQASLFELQFCIQLAGLEGVQSNVHRFHWWVH
jgi:hypothetical protein